MRHSITAAAALLLASTASGHHSDAGLDMTVLTNIEGVINEFSWRNPHVYFTVETTDERGQTTEWAIQMGSTITVARMGWDRDTLASGDHVVVGTHAAIDGRPYGLLQSVTKEGTALPTWFDSTTAEPVLAEAEVVVSASSLEGRWLADGAKLVSYPGGFDGFFRAQLTLTEKGKAAQAALDELTFENPESTCVGRPTPGMILATNLYPLEIEFNEAEDIVYIRSEYFDDERTVYMDGRGHPQSGERTIGGHSIGHWEGDVLVVDTASFADHRSPYQMGLPSGANKHVAEKYWLIEDGARVMVEFMLEDPEYIVDSLTHRRELIHSPHMEMSRFDCDPEVTRRFVPR